MLLGTLTIVLLYKNKECQVISPILVRSMSKSQSSTSSTGDEQLSKILVVSHFNEDLTWIDLFLGEKPKLKYATCDIFFCDSNGTISVELAEKHSM